MIELKDIRNPKCTDCGLCETAKHVCLVGEGNPKADILFVGEAPGADEDDRGRPFVGDAGRLLTNVLAEYKISRRDVYITNAVKCRPPANRKPHVKEIRNCKQYLMAEIKSVKPKLIVGLGRTAMESLLDEKTFTLNSGRGKIFYSPLAEAKGIPIICTYHPAAVKRDNSLITSVFQDFQFILSVLENGVPKRKKCIYKLGVADVEEFVAFDLETTGLNPYVPGSRIIACGTSVKRYTGYCTSKLGKVAGILSNKSILKIGHNIKFDIKWWWLHGGEFDGKIYDTLVAEHLLDENTPSLGLKELAAQYTDMGPYSAELEKTLKEVGGMENVPFSILSKYCAQDVDATLRLRKRQIPRLIEEGLMPLMYLTMAGEMVMARAEYLGVKVDQFKHRKLEKIYRKRLIKLKQELSDLSNGELENPRSTPQIIKVITKQLKLPIIRRTKTNKPSVNVLSLNELSDADTSGFIKLLLKYRNLRGDYSKYLTLKKTLWEPDGKIHCNFNIAGADTGRYTCTNPNLQQVPKKAKSPIKSLFISRYRHGRIVNIDYDQGELRILAQESRDKELIRAFKEKLDIHRLTASKLFAAPYDIITDEERFAAKTINFGIMYGMGIDKLATTTGMSEKEASKFMRDYKAAYIGVKHYIQEKENQILEQGYVTNLFGRRRRINIVDINNIKEVRRAQRQAVNSPIQGGLHDLNVLSMVALSNKLKQLTLKSAIILAVHDSVVLDCPKEETDEVCEVARNIFENPDTSLFNFEFIIPMTCSIGVGENWMEASEGD